MVNTTIIMDEMYYHNKSMEHLTCGIYRVITKDVGKKLMCVASMVIKCSSLDDSINKKVTPKNDIIPCIYGAPKTHKYGVPLIMIVNVTGSMTYDLEKFLAKLLILLSGNINSFLKDSSSFVKCIKNQNVEEDEILVRFDIVSLYTKVLVDHAIIVMEDIAYIETTKLVKICLKSTYFKTKEIYMSKFML